MLYPTHTTRRQTATGTLSTLPNKQTFAAMGETYHNQTPQYNVDPRSNGDLFGNLPRDLQQYLCLALLKTFSEEGWRTYTNSQAVILKSRVPPRNSWVDHAQLNQNHLLQQHQKYQQHQQHQQHQQQQWQQIPPVPIVPQQRPAIFSAPSLGMNQFQTWSQPPPPGNHASSNFNNILTSQLTQQPEKLKSDMGRSVDCPVDRTRSPPPTYTPASAPHSSAKGAGYHNQAPARSHPERRLKYDASRGFTNVLDPKAYPAPLYHPRPQNGPQRYAARRMINKFDKHLRFISELMKEEEEEEQEEEQEYRQEECEEEVYESEDYEEDDSGHEDYEEEANEEKQYPTPISLPPTDTSTPNTSQQPEEEEPELCDQTELNEVLGVYDNTWMYKSKPAITAALYKYKRTRLDRSKYVLDCLMDMTQVNSDEFEPPIRPENNNSNNDNHNNMNDNNHNNNNNNNNNNSNTTTITKRKRRDSSSSWDCLFDSEEEDDGCRSESSDSSSSSKRSHLNDT